MNKLYLVRHCAGERNPERLSLKGLEQAGGICDYLIQQIDINNENHLLTSYDELSLATARRISIGTALTPLILSSYMATQIGKDTSSFWPIESCLIIVTGNSEVRQITNHISKVFDGHEKHRAFNLLLNNLPKDDSPYIFVCDYDKKEISRIDF